MYIFNKAIYGEVVYAVCNFVRCTFQGLPGEPFDKIKPALWFLTNISYTRISTCLVCVYIFLRKTTIVVLLLSRTGTTLKSNLRRARLFRSYNYDHPVVYNITCHPAQYHLEIFTRRQNIRNFHRLSKR